MCIITVMKPGKRLHQDHVRRMNILNGDGIGMAYVDKATQKVVIKKGYLTSYDFIKDYETADEAGCFAENAHMVHFRLATVGGKDMVNCHPFEIKGGAMAHNGTFFGRGDFMGGKSDSRIVAERMYNNFAYPLMESNFEEYEKALGYSRVAFLYDNGKYFITNQKTHGAGWVDDIWYSNGMFRPAADWRNNGEGDEGGMMGGRGWHTHQGSHYGGGTRRFGFGGDR